MKYSTSLTNSSVRILLALGLLLAMLGIAPQRASAATLTVNTVADTAPNGACDASGCTLREAILYSSSGDTIEFSVSGTISLGSTLVINKNLQINGPAGGITLNAQLAATRVMEINNLAVVTISNVTFSGGRANAALTGNAAGLYVNQATVTLNNCTFTNNIAYGASAGAIRNEAGSILTLNQCTISGNSSNSASAIDSSGTLVLEHTTISGNTATVSAPAVQTAGTSFRARNTIIAGNTNGDCSNAFVGAGFVSDGYNMDGGAGCGFTDATDLQNTAPALDSLRNNGGATQTRAPLPGSPAIDAGVCTTIASTTLTSDQRGLPLPVDYDGDTQADCDMGAFELQAAETYAATPTASLANFGATLAKLSTTSGAPGLVTVIRHNSPPGGFPADVNELPVQWTITPTGGTYNVNLTLCYTDAELGAIDENALAIYRWDAGGNTWVSQGGTVDTANNCVALTGVTQLSSWSLAAGAPTAVTLSGITSQTLQPVYGLMVAGLAFLAALIFGLRRLALSRKTR